MIHLVVSYDFEGDKVDIYKNICKHDFDQNEKILAAHRLNNTVLDQ